VSAVFFPFRTTRRVEFCETDAAGIAHFSAFFIYMEQAEHEMLRQLGLSVSMRDDQGEIGWPRVSASCEFSRPAKFEDVLEIEVTVERLGKCSVAYDFRFLRGGDLLATGKMSAVCCRLRPGQLPRAMAIPDAIARKLRGETA
jgi:4-hydroxybenzoyl-CoA thioesterase/acyl-CoA thioester hydrolase